MEKTHLGVCLIEQVSVRKLESPMRREWQAESVCHPSVESITYKNAANFLFRMHKSELCKRTCTEMRKILNCIACLHEYQRRSWKGIRCASVSYQTQGMNWPRSFTSWRHTPLLHGMVYLIGSSFILFIKKKLLLRLFNQRRLVCWCAMVLCG